MKLIDALIMTMITGVLLILLISGFSNYGTPVENQADLDSEFKEICNRFSNGLSSYCINYEK